MSPETVTSTMAFNNLQTAITAAVAANQQTVSAASNASHDSMLHLVSIFFLINFISNF